MIFYSILSENSNNSSEKTSIFRSHSYDVLSKDFNFENWKIDSTQGSGSPIKAFLLSLSTSAIYTPPPPPESPHLFGAETSWQLSSGDARGCITVYRGNGALLPSSKPSFSMKTRGSIVHQVSEGFVSENVVSMSSQIVGVGGISALCSLGCSYLTRGSQAY
jgi:hypothetical protein